MEVEPRKARKKKGKKKARESEELRFAEESELAELQVGSSQSLQEQAQDGQDGIVETALSESDTTQVEIQKVPLARSDSELTSILVVGDEPIIEPKDQVSVGFDDVKDGGNDDGAFTEDPAEITTVAELDQVRREARLSVAEVIEEGEMTNQEYPAQIEDKNEDGKQFEKELETKDLIDVSQVDSESALLVDSQNALSLEEEAPRRNMDPEGENGSMERDESMDFEQPQRSSSDQDFGSEMVAEDVEEEHPLKVYHEMQKQSLGLEEEEGSDHDGEKIGNDTPKSDDVPDIDTFMESVESADSGLGSKTSLPSLYESSQQKEMHKYVVELRQKMADEEINAYLDEFERKVEEEIIKIGDISLEDVQEEERRLREEHIAYQQREARVQRDRQKEFMLAMERAKKHVMQMFREKCRQILMRQEHMMQRDRLLQDRIHRSFRRSENQLLKALKNKKGEVKTMYGDLVFADGQYDGSKCRRWKVDWKRTPQPIQIKLKCLRGVKNKLPASRYVLMASLYSRLGGHIMKWSNLKGQQWGGSTLPVTHDGEFYNIELTIDQSVFAVCPSSPDMKAGMILMFELFILRGSITPTDKVVGWGCFPISDGDFNVVEGKHKAVMLRGNMDSSIDKFVTIEKLIATDIEHWLCNLYFEIIKLPKYLAGQKEYEVELQFSSQTSKLLNKEIYIPDKPLYAYEKEKAPPPSILSSNLSLDSSRPPPYDEIGDNMSDPQPGPSQFSGVNLTIDVPAVPQRDSSQRSASPTASSAKLRKVSKISTDLRKRKPSNGPSPRAPPKDVPQTQRPFTVYGSRKVVEEKGVTLSDDESVVGSEYSDDDVYVVGKGSGLKAIEGQPGMYYKVRQSHNGEQDDSKFCTMLPKTPLLTQQQKRRKLTHLEELEQHTAAIKVKPTKGNVLRRGHTKLQFVRRMLPTELDISQWRAREFWSMMLMLVLTWWIRMYLHYVGQYVLLVGLLIPINSIEYLPYTVNIRYQSTILRTREEIGLLVVGPFTNIIALIILILFTYFFQLLYDRFPNLFARLIMAFGIQTTLDPLWILLVDTAKLRYINLGADNPIGDAYRLFYHFSRYYSNGTVTLFLGVSMTIFLYVVTIFCSCAILYMYFMRLHNNGRMLDIYWRLHEKESSFFSPYDLEMSNEELGYICRKAEQWRGQEGEQRKVNVYHYAWEEEEVTEEEWASDVKKERKGKKENKKASETITHISIHTIHLDGLRELHRHFLRLHNGAIVEVFGEVSIPSSDHKFASPRLGQRNRSYSASSAGSSIAKERRVSSQFLNLPVAAPS